MGDAGAGTVVGALVDQMARTPGLLAVRGEDRSLTYAQLDEVTAQWAHALDAVDPDHRCGHAGVLLPTGAAAVAGLVAATRSGRTLVALDVAWPAERIAELCAQVGPTAVLTEAAHVHLVPARSPSTTVDDLPAHLPTGPPALRAGPDDPFAVTFTSGSTGRPKGAVRTQGTQLQSVRRMREENRYGPGTRLGLVFECTFAACRTAVWGALGNGASLHVRDVRTHGATGLARWLADERITRLSAPASLVDAMFDLDPPDGVLADLEHVAFVGDVLRVATARRLGRYLGPDAEMENAYGSSEMGGVARLRFRADTPLEGSLVPAGVVADHVTLRIVRPDDRGVGEIEVDSPMLSVGYVDAATDARGSFRVEGGRRWFRSGDLGRIRPDGLLELHGRLDDRVKIRAQAVDPAEVERALLDLEGVREAVVVARTVAAERRLVAYVVPEPGAALTVTSVRRALRDRVPSWMIPRSVVVLGAVPRLTRGKVDRAALPDPGPQRPPLDVAHAPPRSPLERAVVDAFEAVLGVAGVGRDDEFFDLGGDSLAATEVAVALGGTLGRDLALDALGPTATPATVADHLAREPEPAGDRLVALQPTGAGTPLVCVHAGHGFVISMAALAATTAGARPFLGVQMLHRDRARDLLSLPRLARRYADLLDRRQPGPVVVTGYSGAGALAHALAAELLARGRVVDGLVLVDPADPRPPLRLGAKKLVYLLHALTGLRSPPAHRTQQRMAVSGFGTRRHAGAPLLAPIVVLRGEVASPLRWEPWAGAGLEVVDVPGDHRAMLEPPRVAVLGERLEAAVQRLEARRPSASAAAGEG